MYCHALNNKTVSKLKSCASDVEDNLNLCFVIYIFILSHCTWSCWEMLCHTVNKNNIANLYTQSRNNQCRIDNVEYLGSVAVTVGSVPRRIVP